MASIHRKAEMLKSIIFWLVQGFRSLAYSAYGIEGVNALLLIMPAKLIVPTLRKYGAKIGEEVILHSPLIIHNAGESYENLEMGNKVYFGRCVFLDLKDKIQIGDRATISMKTTILTHTDVGESVIQKLMPPSHAAVRIKQDAYLGANVTILQGVTIGEAAVLGAGSVVLHDVASHTAAAGNPAKEIKKFHV